MSNGNWSYIDDDPERIAAQLATYMAVKEKADDLIDAAVKEARNKGMTWEQIAKALGTTKQYAHRKYGKR